MKLQLWAGTQTAYETYLAAKTAVDTRLGLSSPFNDMPELPDLLQIQGNIGVITVSGSLIAGNAGYLKYYGVTGYGDIRDALAAAMSSSIVQGILLYIDSGGGSVSGCQETADLINRVAQVKPVVSYASGTEASAALWLGTAASYRFTSQTALTGSLGVMMVHAERSKMLEAEGIKVTVIRAGDSKALANAYEPLSDKAKADKTAQAQTLYDIFLGDVAKFVGMSPAVAESKFGQGVEFIGKQAVDAGLMDAVGSFEDAYQKACELAAACGTQKKKPSGGAKADISANSSDVLANTSQLSGNPADNSATLQGIPMPTPLTPERLAAMAAGVDLSDSPAPTAPATQQAPAANADAGTSAVDELATVKANLVEATAKLESANADMAGMKTQLESLQASFAAMKANAVALGTIVQAGIASMSVALNTQPKADVALDQLAAEYNTVAATFKSKFKVGGVAATNTIEEKTPVKAAIDPLFVLAVKSLNK